jgi:hypothetical protein
LSLPGAGAVHFAASMTFLYLLTVINDLTPKKTMISAINMPGTLVLKNFMPTLWTRLKTANQAPDAVISMEHENRATMTASFITLFLPGGFTTFFIFDPPFSISKVNCEAQSGNLAKQEGRASIRCGALARLVYYLRDTADINMKERGSIFRFSALASLRLL